MLHRMHVPLWLTCITASFGVSIFLYILDIVVSEHCRMKFDTESSRIYRGTIRIPLHETGDYFSRTLIDLATAMVFSFLNFLFLCVRIATLQINANFIKSVSRKYLRNILLCQCPSTSLKEFDELDLFSTKISMQIISWLFTMLRICLGFESRENKIYLRLIERCVCIIYYICSFKTKFTEIFPFLTAG